MALPLQLLFLLGVDPQVLAAVLVGHFLLLHLSEDVLDVLGLAEADLVLPVLLLIHL